MKFFDLQVILLLNNIAGDNGFNTVTYISFIPIIIENNRVIYAQNLRYGSEGTFTQSREEANNLPIAINVKEEHVEELVRRAMKRYVKRLER